MPGCSALLTNGLVVVWTLACLGIVGRTSAAVINEYEYLMNYGYLSEKGKETGMMQSGEELTAAIKNMQAFTGIPQTGVLDQMTKDAMQQPRCGVRDIPVKPSNYLREPADTFRSGTTHRRAKRRSTSRLRTLGAEVPVRDTRSAWTDDEMREGRSRLDPDWKQTKTKQVQTGGKKSRRKRFARMGTQKWENKYVTYCIRSYSERLEVNEVRLALRDAFRAWAEVTNLVFLEVMNGKADIDINFRSRIHGDPYPFDGPGHVLAHAFSPGINRGGDIHFDADERWVNSEGHGSHSFPLVAIHEIGHSLGLDHSVVKGSTMFPIYIHSTPENTLHRDDIEGIRSIYGYKRRENSYNRRTRPRYSTSTSTTTSTTTTTTTTTTQMPTYVTRYDSNRVYNVCGLGMIDSIASIRRELFFFKDNVFWRKDRHGLVTKRPTKISSFWYYITSRVDAAYERSALNRNKKMTSTIVIFSGNKYWVHLSNNRLVSGFPKEGKHLTTMGLPHTLSKIDAAFNWKYNKKSYIISGDMYWRLNDQTLKVESGYPKQMNIWEGVPLPVATAFTHTVTGNTYFVDHKGNYYKFNDPLMRVYSRASGFPRPLAQDWLDCPSEVSQSAAAAAAPHPPAAPSAGDVLKHYGSGEAGSGGSSVGGSGGSSTLRAVIVSTLTVLLLIRVS